MANTAWEKYWRFQPFKNLIKTPAKLSTTMNYDSDCQENKTA